MRLSPIRPASADSTPVALRGKASLRAVCATALAAAIGFAPAVMIASPAAAAIPGFTFDDSTVSAAEGGTLTFKISRDGGDISLAAKTLEWHIVSGSDDSDEDHTATVDVDYTDASGELEFAADSSPSNDQSMEIEVSGLADTLDENSETFTLVVTDAADEDNTIEAVGTLTDDDAAPSYTLDVSALTVDETAVDEETLNSVAVTAELSTASGRDISIPVSTVAGTAKAVQDYVAIAPGATIEIEAGDTTGELVTNIDIVDDALYEEALQTFTVKGATSTNTTGSHSVEVSIADDEEQSQLTVTGGESVIEGLSENFQVLLTPLSERPVTVRWDTMDGPGPDKEDADEDTGVAKAGVDYTTAGATLTFTSEQNSKTITVKTIADTLDEVDPEDFHVHLSDATVAAIDEADSTASITDNDDPPAVTMTPTTIAEGDAGATAKTFTVKLSKASGQPVTVTYDVTTGGDVQASAGTDFTTKDGELLFAPGETTKTFTVNVVGDNTYEPDETFQVNLGTDGTATLAEEIIDVEITDDDTQPTFSVAPVTMMEGDGGSVALFTVKLSNPTYEDVTFDVTEAAGGSAVEGGTVPGANDYEAPNALVTIPAGQVNGYVYFLVNGDEVYELTETVKLTIGLDADSEDFATGIDKTATLTLTNDDAAPVLTVVPTAGTEGTTVDATAVVTGVAQSDTFFTVSFTGSSANGSDAAEADDFTNPGSTQVSVDGGTASGTVIDLASVKFTDDTVGEPSETIVVSGTGPVGAFTSSVLTILDNDNYAPAVKPTLNVGPVRFGVGPMPITGKVAANASVELWAAPVGGGALGKVATATADAQGNYTFSYNFTDTGMRFATKATGLTSVERTVWLKHDPTLIAASNTKGTATLKVNGDPTLGGLNVILQQYLGNGQWKKAGVGTTGASGLLIKTIYGLRTGSTYTFRAYVVGDASKGLQGGYSGVRRATIK